MYYARLKKKQQTTKAVGITYTHIYPFLMTQVPPSVCLDLPKHISFY